MLVYHDGEALYIANATADSEPRRISPTGVGSYYPTWSPDGSRIAFVADGTVCTVRANGSAARAVAYRASYGIAWQPARYSVGGEPRYPCVATRWDLALHVTASRKRAAVGDDVAFSVAPSNKGPHPAVESPEFIIEWGEDLQFGSVDTSGRLGEECAPLVRSGHWITAVSCRADIVFPGRPVTIATVTLGARGPGPQLVTAAMREFSHPHDTNLDNDRGSATVRIGGCTITGTSGSDILIGTRRSDVICGVDGNDVVRGLGGNDEIWSGPATTSSTAVPETTGFSRVSATRLQVARVTTSSGVDSGATASPAAAACSKAEIAIRRESIRSRRTTRTSSTAALERCPERSRRRGSPGCRDANLVARREESSRTNAIFFPSGEGTGESVRRARDEPELVTNAWGSSWQPLGG